MGQSSSGPGIRLFVLVASWVTLVEGALPIARACASRTWACATELGASGAWAKMVSSSLVSNALENAYQVPIRYKCMKANELLIPGPWGLRDVQNWKKNLALLLLSNHIFYVPFKKTNNWREIVRMSCAIIVKNDVIQCVCSGCLCRHQGLRQFVN